MKKLTLLLVFLAIPCGSLSAQQYSSDPSLFMSARLAAEEGNFREALSTLDKLIARNPSDPILLYERANILSDARDNDRAVTELRKLVKLYPDFYDARRLLGRLLLDKASGDNGAINEAMENLRAAYKLNPDDLPTGMAVAQLLVSLDRTAEAEKVLAALAERAPDNRAVNFNYAQVLTKLGRGDESQPYLERVLEVDPTYAPAVSQLADIYQKKNQWGKAADILQPLIDLDPLNVDLERQQAVFYLRAGESEKARQRFEQLLRTDPKDERTKFFYAEALSDTDHYAEALKIYDELLAKNPDDPDFLIGSGVAQLGSRDFDKAEATFQHLLTVKDLPPAGKAMATAQLAVIAHQKKDYDRALSLALESLAAQDRPSRQALGVALDVYKRQSKWDEALKLISSYLTKFDVHDPQLNARYVEFLVRSGDLKKADEVAHTEAAQGKLNAIAVAEAFAQTQQFDRAIAILKDLSAKNADDSDITFQLGATYERAGKIAEAEKIFLNILAASPDNAATLNYLGYMWADRGTNLDRAASMLEHAVQLEPDNAAYLDSLGWAYFRLGKLDLAEKYLTSASKLLPRDATVQEHMGDLLAKKGDSNAALDRYKAALSYEPEAKDEAKLRQKIAEIERKSSGRQP